MAERLCCSKGHKWDPVFPPADWPPDFRSACPVCGEPPIGPFDISATTGRVMVVLAVVFVLFGLPFLLFLKTIPFAVIFFIAAGIIPLIFLGTWSARQRTKKMADIAESMGFAFMAHLTLNGLRAVAPFRLFKQGHSQKVYHALLGRVGACDVIFFEYQYVTGGGKSSQTHLITAVILPDGAAGVPEFQLAPRTFFDKFVGLFTHNSIELEDAGEFTRRCKLTGLNESALRETFHPDLVQYLGSDGRWFIEVVDGQLLLYVPKRLAPDKCPGVVTDALEIRDLLQNAGRST